jgi:predicted nucleotidyltransferase component of viral defense system
MNKTYLDTARMLVQVAPLVFRESPFALKGGTAINLFVRDMPRLSVDLDLVFTDHRLAREAALASINNALAAAADRLKAHRFTVRLQAAADTGDTKLFVRRDKMEVKIEANFVLRGTVHPVRTASLTTKAREALQAELEIPVVANEDLYAGKLVAALDRQHPRDLFDVMQLMAGGGITPQIRRTFVIYLACHNRPIHELLSPALRDISQEYERTFAGMTADPVALSELLATREAMVADLRVGLNSDDREFLLSVARAEPDWSKTPCTHASELPALQWKLLNLRKFRDSHAKRFAAQHDELRKQLELHHTR